MIKKEEEPQFLPETKDFGGSLRKYDMKAKNTYWVGYTYSFSWFDKLENEWTTEDFSDARRFHCLKKDIKKEVVEYLTKDITAEYGEIRDLKVDIYKCYLTTDWEN